MKFAADPDVVAEAIAKKRHCDPTGAEPPHFMVSAIGIEDRCQYCGADWDEVCADRRTHQAVTNGGAPLSFGENPSNHPGRDGLNDIEPNENMEGCYSSRGTLKAGQPLAVEGLGASAAYLGYTDGKVPLPADIRTRIGRFTISRQVLVDRIDAVRAMLAHVIVVDARSNFAMDVIDYYGWSTHFEALCPGDMAPEYDIEWLGDYRFSRFIKR